MHAGDLVIARDDQSTGDGGLLFTTDNPAAPDGVNRVIVQTDDGTVTVNVGVAATHTPNPVSPFLLQQSDTLPTAGSTPVWVIATGSM